MDPASQTLVQIEVAGDGTRQTTAVPGHELLSQVVQVELTDVPLAEALRRIADEHRVPLVMEGRRTEEAGVAADEPVSLAAGGMTLAGVLDRLLARRELDYALRGGTVWVSTKEQIARCCDVRLYNVQDLAANEPGGVQAIAERMQAMGASDPETIGERWLVIAAPRSLHERIEDWLTEQRTGEKPRRAVERDQLQEDLERQAAEDERRNPTLRDPFAPPPPAEEGQPQP